MFYLLSALSRSDCSKFVAFSNSSINESGFGRVTSTRHGTEFPLPSSAFFLRSKAALARSNDPVSLEPQLADGFLNQTHNKILQINSQFNK